MKDDRLYFVHILECIDHILQFTIDGTNSFLADRKTQVSGTQALIPKGRDNTWK
ncbi:hypothetical protein [Desulfomonile tiedjei]|uniref:Uncharacterized protein n=1 Tax=Desulfomonile tiedjei (strain ATCC 49306 / DSM 6799 / DCB-1) TaxID=706587 RepID=I4CBX4_DESTA|nr:hypothetical protein [Desulfomonile tiedjei]AFM27065.1 hypothetical protein Desti_4433 [Desulfomonile tiedjei DSM 6799]